MWVKFEINCTQIGLLCDKPILVCMLLKASLKTNENNKWQLDELLWKDYDI